MRIAREERLEIAISELESVGYKVTENKNKFTVKKNKFIAEDIDPIDVIILSCERIIG